MLKAILVDDETPNNFLLKRAIDLTGQLEVIAQFNHPREALEKISHIKADVAFIDIEMPGMNGLELAEKIQSISPDIDIVFVTAYSEYAIDAFKVNALDYILKPHETKEINRVISKIISKNSYNNFNKFSSPKTSTKCESRISCIGNFEVCGIKSDKNVHWITSKAEELFAYIIIHLGNRINKWVLCELLWPDQSPNKAITNLHTSIYRLKNTLTKEKVPVQIKYSNDSYWAEIGDVFFDYQEFNNIALYFRNKNFQIENDNDINLLVKATSYYNGELFTNKNYIWSMGYKENLEQTNIKILHLLADYYRKNQYLDMEKLYLNKILEFYPYDERAFINIMEVYKKQQDKISLIKQYEKYEKFLKDQIGCSPSREILWIYHNIKKNL